MKNVLFINACARPGSRTRRLAEYLLRRIGESYTEVALSSEKIRPLDRKRLETRDHLLALGAIRDPMFRYAHQFKEADIIVIAAPYWDLSFPASLKDYIERINAVGITFDYTEDGRPYTCCRAKKLYYVTTAGGEILSDEFGYGYIRSLCERFYEIPETYYIKAEGLDLIGADVKEIMRAACCEIDRLDMP